MKNQIKESISDRVSEYINRRETVTYAVSAKPSYSEHAKRLTPIERLNPTNMLGQALFNMAIENFESKKVAKALEQNPNADRLKVLNFAEKSVSAALIPAMYSHKGFWGSMKDTVKSFVDKRERSYQKEANIFSTIFALFPNIKRDQLAKLQNEDFEKQFGEIEVTSIRTVITNTTHTTLHIQGITPEGQTVNKFVQLEINSMYSPQKDHSPTVKMLDSKIKQLYLQELYGSDIIKQKQASVAVAPIKHNSKHLKAASFEFHVRPGHYTFLRLDSPKLARLAWLNPLIIKPYLNILRRREEIINKYNASFEYRGPHLVIAEYPDDVELMILDTYLGPILVNRRSDLEHTKWQAKFDKKLSKIKDELSHLSLKNLDLDDFNLES